MKKSFRPTSNPNTLTFWAALFGRKTRLETEVELRDVTDPTRDSLTKTFVLCSIETGYIYDIA